MPRFAATTGRWTRGTGRQQVRVFRPAVVEHLNLHPDVRGVSLERRANADAVVRVLRQPELEAEDEVRVFPVREQVAAVLLRREEDAVLHLIAVAGLVGAPRLVP